MSTEITRLKLLFGCIQKDSLSNRPKRSLTQITVSKITDLRPALVLQIWTCTSLYLGLQKIVYLWSSWEEALVWSFLFTPYHNFKKIGFSWLSIRLMTRLVSWLMFNYLAKLTKILFSWWNQCRFFWISVGVH